MSFMGKGVTKNAVICLLHLSHEMMKESKNEVRNGNSVDVMSRRLNLTLGGAKASFSNMISRLYRFIPGNLFNINLNSYLL